MTGQCQQFQIASLDPQLFRIDPGCVWKWIEACIGQTVFAIDSLYQMDEAMDVIPVFSAIENKKMVFYLP